MYRLRLADANAARIRFLQVAGPIRPTPTPYLKPQDAAQAARYAAIVARAPLPRLKPVLETSLGPGTDPPSAPIPAEPPEARRPAQAGPDGRSPFAASGQTITALARMPQARPALASHDLRDAGLTVVVWPELKPDGLSAMKGAAPPPQPELKPKEP